MREKTKEIIAQALGIEVSDVEETASLRTDLELKEADLTELVNTINQDFKTNIPAEEALETKTVREFIELVEKYGQEEL